MGNSPPPVKSLPGIEAGLASGIIFAVSSLWLNSGGPEGWRASPSPPNPGVPGFGNHRSVDIGNIRCRLKGRVDAERMRGIGVG